MMIKISDYMHPNLITFFEASSRDEALRTLINTLFLEGKIENAETFYEAIVEREKIVSTGIGMGVAIPHAKLPALDDFFITVGILQKGVDWTALDGAPVRMIFMIGGPDDKQTEYLQILSCLTTAIKDEARRKKILTLNSKDAMMQLFNAL
jgi:PTS system nitrogen regulatory IIA component